MEQSNSEGRQSVRDDAQTRELDVSRRTFQRKLALAFLKSRDDSPHLDVSLVCDGEIFRAHKIILVASSGYFYDLFVQQQEVSNELSLSEINSDIMDIALHFIYSGTLKINHEDPERVKHCLELLKMTNLMQHRCELMLSSLTPHHYKFLWHLASVYNLKDMEKNIAKFIGKNFEACTKIQEFVQLNLRQIIAVFSCEEIRKSSEASQINAICNWIQYNSPVRDKYTTSLLAVSKISTNARSKILARLDENILNVTNDIDLKKNRVREIQERESLTEKRAWQKDKLHCPSSKESTSDFTGNVDGDCSNQEMSLLDLNVLKKTTSTSSSLASSQTEPFVPQTNNNVIAKESSGFLCQLRDPQTRKHYNVDNTKNRWSKENVTASLLVRSKKETTALNNQENIWTSNPDIADNRSECENSGTRSSQDENANVVKNILALQQIGKKKKTKYGQSKISSPSDEIKAKENTDKKTSVDTLNLQSSFETTSSPRSCTRFANPIRGNYKYINDKSQSSPLLSGKMPNSKTSPKSKSGKISSYCESEISLVQNFNVADMEDEKKKNNLTITACRPMSKIKPQDQIAFSITDQNRRSIFKVHENDNSFPEKALASSENCCATQAGNESVSRKINLNAYGASPKTNGHLSLEVETSPASTHHIKFSPEKPSTLSSYLSDLDPHKLQATATEVSPGKYTIKTVTSEVYGNQNNFMTIPKSAKDHSKFMTLKDKLEEAINAMKLKLESKFDREFSLMDDKIKLHAGADKDLLTEKLIPINEDVTFQYDSTTENVYEVNRNPNCSRVPAMVPPLFDLDKKPDEFDLKTDQFNSISQNYQTSSASSSITFISDRLDSDVIDSCVRKCEFSDGQLTDNLLDNIKETSNSPPHACCDTRAFEEKIGEGTGFKWREELLRVGTNYCMNQEADFYISGNYQIPNSSSIISPRDCVNLFKENPKSKVCERETAGTDSSWSFSDKKNAAVNKLRWDKTQNYFFKSDSHRNDAKIYKSTTEKDLINNRGIINSESFTIFPNEPSQTNPGQFMTGSTHNSTLSSKWSEQLSKISKNTYDLVDSPRLEQNENGPNCRITRGLDERNTERRRKLWDFGNTNMGFLNEFRSDSASTQGKKTFQDDLIHYDKKMSPVSASNNLFKHLQKRTGHDLASYRLESVEDAKNMPNKLSELHIVPIDSDPSSSRCAGDYSRRTNKLIRTTNDSFGKLQAYRRTSPKSRHSHAKQNDGFIKRTLSEKAPDFHGRPTSLDFAYQESHEAHISYSQRRSSRQLGTNRENNEPYDIAPSLLNIIYRDVESFSNQEVDSLDKIFQQKMSTASPAIESPPLESKCKQLLETIIQQQSPSFTNRSANDISHRRSIRDKPESTTESSLSSRSTIDLSINDEDEILERASSNNSSNLKYTPTRNLPKKDEKYSCLIWSSMDPYFAAHGQSISLSLNCMDKPNSNSAFPISSRSNSVYLELDHSSNKLHIDKTQSGIANQIPYKNNSKGLLSSVDSNHNSAKMINKPCNLVSNLYFDSDSVSLPPSARESPNSIATFTMADKMHLNASYSNNLLKFTRPESSQSMKTIAKNKSPRKLSRSKSKSEKHLLKPNPYAKQLSQTSSTQIKFDKNLVPLASEAGLAIVFLAKDASGTDIRLPYNLENKKWLSPLPVKVPRLQDDYSSCHSKNAIYFIGGSEGSSFRLLHSAFEYNCSSDILRQLPNLIVARTAAAICVVDEFVYVLGGIGIRHRVLAQVERLNPSDNSWKLMAPLITPRTNMSVVSQKQLLYVFGGTKTSVRNEFPVLLSCERYDPSINQWTVIANLPIHFETFNPLAVSAGHKIYAIRLRNPDTVYRFSASQDKWITIRNTKLPLRRVGILLASENKLYAMEICGRVLYSFDLHSYQWNIESYFPHNMEWAVHAYITNL